MATLASMLDEYHQAVISKSKTPSGIPVYLHIANDVVSQAGDELLEIVQAVVRRGVYYTLTNGRRCYFCEAETDQFTGEPPHTPDCPVTKAHDLLTSPP